MRKYGHTFAFQTAILSSKVVPVKRLLCVLCVSASVEHAELGLCSHAAIRVSFLTSKEPIVFRYLIALLHTITLVQRDGLRHEDSHVHCITYHYQH